MFKEKFCSIDNLLDGFSFDDLITTIVSNEKEITDQTIIKVFNELMNEQRINAKELLTINLQNIKNQIIKGGKL